ncbi:MAG TPA: glycosyltransferase [Anaerolineales bacterium]|nr:glycosyltransferase [Anaerolineales bacterium]
MLDLLFVPVAVLYLLLVAALFLYGLNFFYLTYLALRNRGAEPIAPDPQAWPRVTVQLPVYNELYVAERLIEAAAALDYPSSLLEIQVLDDSTDETVAVIEETAKRLKARGVDVVHIHRSHRTGFKAGALAEGLAQARGEFLAIFDADFVPPPDFLRRTLPHFQDPKLAFVQTRWGHLNRDYSLLTFLQSLAIDAHFMVEQFARNLAGYWFNFNGTAGVWRRSALEDAGGWTADTLTEDLDLSYRAFLRGWRALYLRQVDVPAELPANFSAYRRQQQRWARGSLECARKLLPHIWRSQNPFRIKLQATLHLTGYGVHLLLFALMLLYPLVVVLSQRVPSLIFALFGLAIVFNLTALAPSLLFAVAQKHLGRAWWRMAPAILFITVLGAGMMLNTVRAASHIFFGRRGVFERTPKFGLLQQKQGWQERRYQMRLDPIVYSELFFAAWSLGTITLALHAGNWVIAAYASLFAVGLLFTSGVTILQALAVRRSRGRSAPHSAVAGA